ncbi:MAG: hypothetical protein U0840_21875 [Gemmataceae bacterium]
MTSGKRSATKIGGLDQPCSPPREAPEVLQDEIQARVLLEPPPQPKFVASARRNRRQVDARLRTLDRWPNALPVAHRHDVTPPARIGRFLSESPPVDVPGVDPLRLRRPVGVGERQIVPAAQPRPDQISPFGTNKDRAARRPQRFTALGGPAGFVQPPLCASAAISSH